MRSGKLFSYVMFTVLGVLNVCLAQSTSDDRKAIVEHIHGIFNAFVQGDTVAIKAMHTEDWTGFQNNSREIIRGIEAYMVNPRKNLPILKMLEYELEDVEVQVYGELAIVYYIATWKSLIKSAGRVLKTRARSVDIYKKENGAWNQAGSHLSVLPAPARERGPDCRSCFDVELVEE